MKKEYKKVDKDSYNIFYKGQVSELIKLSCIDEYEKVYKIKHLSPFYKGGSEKGYVRGLSFRKLLESAKKKNIPFDQITVLDAGCGRGELSVYLAIKGFNVIGIDISSEACKDAGQLAERMKVAAQCTFLSESLEELSIPGQSIDFIVGYAALHHFIKYKRVPKEFDRILKKNGSAFFADSFGENRTYHLFHYKEKMKRLGDVILTKRLIVDYFKDYDLELYPTDWFTMLDKLYMKLFPKKAELFIRKVSIIHFYLDRLIPAGTRLSLFLSGAVMTSIKKK